MHKVLASMAFMSVLALSACGGSDAEQWADDAGIDTTEFTDAANDFHADCKAGDLDQLTSGCGEKLSTVNDRAIDLAVAIDDARDGNAVPDEIDEAGEAAVNFNRAYTKFGEGPRTAAVKEGAVKSLESLEGAVKELN